MMSHRQFRPLGNTDDGEIAAPAWKALEAIHESTPDFFEDFRGSLGRI
jgi:hypothetical protein